MCPGSKKLLEGKENEQPVHERLFLKAQEPKEENKEDENKVEPFKPKVNTEYNNKNLGTREIPID